MDIQNDFDIVKNFSMSDKLIREYIPDVNIVIYNNLSKYKCIEDLLPNNKDFAIILYVTSYSYSTISGHYVSVSRLDNQIYYFDSYGFMYDHWFRPNKYQSKKYLTELLENSKLPIFYNKIQYQQFGDNISTCGRYNIVLYKLLQNNKNMYDMYIDFKKLRLLTGMSYDQIASYLISKI